jgi:hypothetical protein
VITPNFRSSVVAIPTVDSAGGGMTNGIVDRNAVEAQAFD